MLAGTNNTQCAWLLIAAAAVAFSATSASAQIGALPYISASGTTAIGFSSADLIDVRASAPGVAALPCDLEVAPMLRPLVERIWTASPTFRRQCERLSRAAQTVIVSITPNTSIAGTNADTEVTRKRGLVVNVHLRSVCNLPMYLAHEIEHVLEQLDDIDLKLSALRGVDGVHRTDGNVYETVRAIQVGRRVGREVDAYGK